MATPGYVFSKMAEMPPSASPSRRAYIGAVNGDQVFLKMVTSATTKPPMIPPAIHGYTASGVFECASPQVHAAVATTQSKSRPVLLTVPCNVIASPAAASPLKAFSLRAGLDVRMRLAMAASGKVRTHFTLHQATNPNALASLENLYSARSCLLLAAGDLALNLCSKFERVCNLLECFRSSAGAPNNDRSIAEHSAQGRLFHDYTLNS